MRVTAKEVARQAGVSASTVSLVFQNKGSIRPEVRQKVFAAAAAIGYRPGGSAAGAAQPVIQLVLYKKHGKVVSDTPFFENLTKGISDRVQALGYQLRITYYYAAQDAAEQLRSLQNSRPAGLLLLTTEMHTRDLDAFEALGLPLVLLDNWFPAKSCDAVVIDNLRGAYHAVQFLIQCGHTRLGYLSSKVDIRNFTERREGYLAAVRSLKDPHNDSAQRIVRVGTTVESACADMTAYLATDPVLPTAFFADNDLIAAGCLRALRRAGYRVPEDISLIGFDDMSICELTEPPLTTMAVPKERLGALAVDRLDRRIRGETGGETIRLLVQPEIVVRASVRPIH